ncbi:MAG: hypothetical protein WC570_02955 [Patescibacteria group bacterium]
MTKSNKGFITHVQSEESDELLRKLISLKKYWEWADKLKDQYLFYLKQEEKNIQLKRSAIIHRDSSMFFIFYLAVLSQVIKSFDEGPKVIVSLEIKGMQDELGFNLSKFGEAMCFPGKSILNEKLLDDVMKSSNIQKVNNLHIGLGYFINKKIQELKNRDVFPYAMNKM